MIEKRLTCTPVILFIDFSREDARGHLFLIDNVGESYYLDGDVNNERPVVDEDDLPLFHSLVYKLNRVFCWKSEFYPGPTGSTRFTRERSGGIGRLERREAETSGRRLAVGFRPPPRDASRFGPGRGATGKRAPARAPVFPGLAYGFVRWRFWNTRGNWRRASR